MFDDENLVSDAGLVPVMALAEQAGLSELLAEKVGLDALEPARVASAGVNPAGKLTSIIAGMPPARTASTTCKRSVLAG